MYYTQYILGAVLCSEAVPYISSPEGSSYSGPDKPRPQLVPDRTGGL